MGNTVSKVVDFGLKVACKVTGGLFGTSSEGFHLGPLRLKKNSIGVSMNYGFGKVGLKIGKNEYGKFALEGSVGGRFDGIASGTIKCGVDSGGIYAGLFGELNIRKVKGFVGIAGDTSGNVRKLEFGLKGPLMSNVKYSKEHGISKGLGGINVDENGEIDSSVLQNAVIGTVEDQVANRVTLFKQRYQSENKKKVNEIEKAPTVKKSDIILERNEVKNEDASRKERNNERKHNREAITEPNKGRRRLPLEFSDIPVPKEQLLPLSPAHQRLDRLLLMGTERLSSLGKKTFLEKKKEDDPSPKIEGARGRQRNNERKPNTEAITEPNKGRIKLSIEMSDIPVPKELSLPLSHANQKRDSLLLMGTERLSLGKYTVLEKRKEMETSPKTEPVTERGSTSDVCCISCGRCHSNINMRAFSFEM